MLSLLLITAALAVQYPQPAPKAPTRTSRATQATPRDSNTSRGAAASVSRTVFHDRMRELWSDHIAYTRNFIVSASAGLPDTSEVSQRLLRNQDEIGEAIKPYFGDAAGSQLASLLRSHIALAAKTLVAAKGNNVSMQNGMNMQDSSGQYISSNMYSSRTDTSVRRRDSTQVSRLNSQYPTQTGRVADTTKSTRRDQRGVNPTGADTVSSRIHPTYGDTAASARSTRVRPPANARAQGDTANTKVPYGQYGNARTDTTARATQSREFAQGQYQGQNQTGQVDSTTLNQAIASLRANGDSIATLLASTNTRGWSQETLKGAIQMHLNLLLQEATAQLKKDWSGSIAAYDESQHQAMQMADMLSDGIIKQFPSRFTNKATAVSSR